MGGVLVKAARHHQSIPSYDRALPHAPALVQQLVADGPRAVGQWTIAAVFGVLGNEVVAVFVVVDLRGFEADLIYPQLLSQSQHVVDLVFVVADHQALEDDVRRRGPCSFAGSNHVSHAGFGLFQIAVDAVLLVGVLGAAVERDDEAIQSRFNGFTRIFGVKEVGVGGGCGVDTRVVGLADQGQEVRVDVRLTLEVKSHVTHVALDLAQDIAEEIGLEVTGGTRELFEARRTLRTTQVAGGGGLNAQREGLAPDQRFFEQAGQVVAGPQQSGVPHPGGGGAAQQCMLISRNQSHVHKIRDRSALVGKSGVLPSLV